MELRYNLTGAQRKALVEAISQQQGTKAKYLGMPSAAYQIGDYHIDKNGMVSGPDDIGLEDALQQQGFTAESHEYDEPDTYESGLGGMGATEIINLADCETADDNEEDGTLAIEIPMRDFDQAALDNLGKLIDSKRELIKAAIGYDTVLPVVPTTGGKLRFEWFPYTQDPEEVTAYAQFISLLCDTAKAKKRVTSKERSTDNMKFAMRVWLISLGMVGKEYGFARKLLTKNLPGNSAFSKGRRPTYTANCYTYPNGEETDPMDCESFEFPSFTKAKARCDEFLADCESVKFAGAHVEDDNGKYVYEILVDGTVMEK